MQEKQEIKGMQQKLNEMHEKAEEKRVCPARMRRAPAARKYDTLYPYKNMQAKHVIKTTGNKKGLKKKE